MLHVYHSNRLEALFILLSQLRKAHPPADPLIPETILVANPGISRWLNFRIAAEDGIAANIDYVLPATFVWRLYQNCLNDVPERSSFERGPLKLQVHRLLEDIIGDVSNSVWHPLQKYASSGGSVVEDAKRVQLASRIADVFDQYLVYRPDMLLTWEKGSNDIPGNDSTQLWQPALWRKLTQRINEPHRAKLWNMFCRQSDAGELDVSRFPHHLHLFNVGLLPPSTLDVLVRVASANEKTQGKPEGADRVSVYFLNPAVDYWADLVDLRRMARDRLKLGNADNILSDEHQGNPLLSSLGGSGQALLKLLGERSQWVHDERFFLPPENKNLLSAIQRDLLHPFDSKNLPAGLPANEDDDSVQFHQSYSSMRELQALHDDLLDRFNTCESLTPADILVMVPDINSYAPIIEAVFGSADSGISETDKARHIPWSIADRSLVDVSQVIVCVQRLFELPSFEFEATAVLAFAAEPAIARRFGFDDQALRTLNQWIRDTGIRRTLAGAQEQALNAAIPTPHSIDFGIRRILLGRAMPTGAQAIGDTLPWTEIDGQQAALLSQFLDMLDELANTSRKLAASRSISEWVLSIHDIVDTFLQADDTEADALAQFREVLAELDNDASGSHENAPLSHATFSELLRGTLAVAQHKNHRYLTGRVTFSSMVPLRSVPFGMVCMLGLNDADFPRRRPSLGFDLVALQPREGDRSVRDDDRYLFLEAILSARDELYLSWIYRNPADNSEREPSVLVSEFRDYLEARYPQVKSRVVEHPLQPFSEKLFVTDNQLQGERAPLHSFATEWAPLTKPLPAVDLTSTVEKQSNNKLAGSISTPLIKTPVIGIRDFQRFWRNPSDWYCRNVLGLALWRDESVPDDAEPFALGGLEAWQVRQDLLNIFVSKPDHDPRILYTRFRQSGTLPHGALGELVFNSLYEESKRHAKRINDLLSKSLPYIEVDISIDGQRLQGRLQNCVMWDNGEVGLLHYSASDLKGRHYAALRLEQLMGSAAGVLTGPSSVVVRNTSRRLEPITREDAENNLRHWLDGWNHGQNSALPFFADTSAALAGLIRSNAESIWNPPPPPPGMPQAPGESEQEAIALLYPDPAAVLRRDDVLQWATRIYNFQASLIQS